MFMAHLAHYFCPSHLLKSDMFNLFNFPFHERVCLSSGCFSFEESILV